MRETASRRKRTNMHAHVLQLVLPPQLEVQALLQGTLDTRDTADMLALVVWVELVPL